VSQGTTHGTTHATSHGRRHGTSLTRQATIFDLDDTLVDSGAAWGRVCGAFAARYGHGWRAEDDAALHGNGGWASYVAGLCGDAVSAAEVLETCTSAMAEECAAGRVKALPGAVDLVLEAERHGPVGLATASPRRYVLAALSALALTGRMRTVVCGEDVTCNKPAPDPYLRAAAEVGIAPYDCLAVEDSPRGIRSAAAAGMRVLAVPRGGMTLPTDVAHLPAAYARDAADALPLLTMMLTSRPEPAVYGGLL
jgi:HAD superfamily hydrolase (TIGR01509 family)